VPKQYLYSPFPIEAYHLTGMPQDEARVIGGIKNRLPYWNMFFLSVPALDHLPGSGADWWRQYTPVSGACPAIMEDVREDDVMIRKLVMHPDNFAEWWERQDHSIYEAYYLLGEDDWAATVLRRAKAAAVREASTHPRVQVDGNVLHVDFRRAA